MEKQKKVIIVSGGAGYIGTHTVVSLLEAGYRVVVLDNLDNSSEEALKRVRRITDCSDDDLVFHEVDLTKYENVAEVFEKLPKALACIHFAALKAVGESMKLPLHYYYNNLTSCLHLLHFLQQQECTNFIFSSSATVYGDPEVNPITEEAKVGATNPYGRTKEFIEKICQDLVVAHPGFQVSLLRYFNPIGAHESGLIGEDPQGFPNNLIPFVSQVAIGKREKLSVFGGDWPTPDGTGVRDYIHVTDLALGHVAALKRLSEHKNLGVEVFNLGTGHGVSVLEVVRSFEAASGKKIPYEIVARRPGDIPTCYAEPKKAMELLNWTAKLDIDRMCQDTWRWQSSNPNGFRTQAQLEEAARSPAPRKADVFKMYGN